MKSTKKIFALICAGALALVALTGCFSSGGSNGGSNGGSSSSESIPTGTYKLSAAYAYDGSEYDVSGMADQVKLVVSSATKATFYYFDDDKFEGTLSRETSQDSAYAADGFTTQAYFLTGADGSYWEFCYVVPNDDASAAFIYLTVGSDQPDSLYLAK